MNKKFLSAILFGALMVTSTGTFVSCKDYDDEIENLRSQINNLATKSDVEAKLSQLQAALDAAKAESSANAAKIAAIKQCECDVDAMMKKIQDAVDADMKKYADEINALIEQAEAIVGEIADYVTSVELVDSYTAANGNWVNAAKRGHVVVSTTIEKDNVFSKDIANAITFVKGTEIQTPNSFLVRVSPTNAVLTPEMISLVNSKGESLADVMEVVKVEKADVLLSRGATNNGLWNINVQAKNYGDGKAFATATLVDTKKAADAAGNRVLFAAQVNNSLASAEARYVSSTYDLSFGWTKFVSAAELNFTVDGTDVAEINNRFDNTSVSLKQTTNLGTIAKEYEWATSTADYPTPAVAMDKDKKNVVAVEDGDDDDRSEEAVVLAVQGKAMKIALFETDANGEKVAPKNVRAIYVTLDKANAVESAPSELNAWNSYSYTGLNTVVEGTSTEITINGEQTINDYIGFRVYAVNYDGTLVDPDGKAFYVLVGKQAQEFTGVATSITPVSEELVATDAVEVDKLDEITGAVKWSWKVAGEGNQPFHLALADKDGKAVKFDGVHDAIFTYTDGTEGVITAAMDWSKVKSVYAIPSQAWYKYEDGKAYTGVLTLKTTTGHVLANLNVSFTKNIPTAAPEGLSIKTNQVVDGIYNCYMIPMKNTAAAGADPVYVEFWAAKTAKFGSMAMNQIFNFPENTAANYTIKFATSKYNSDNEAYTDVKPVAGDGKIIVDADLIDNTSKHATTATYNYGMISSAVYAAAAEANKPAGDPAYNYVVNVPEINFETVYNCIYNDTYTWAWATREQLANLNANWLEKNTDGSYKYELPTLTLKYGESMNKVAYNNGANKEADLEQFIYGVSTKDNRFSAFLATPYQNTSLKIVKEKTTFTSDANGKQEYFEPLWNGDHLQGLKFIPTASNPEADVPSTLTITVVDMYGHERVIKIAGIVKKQ